MKTKFNFLENLKNQKTSKTGKWKVWYKSNRLTVKCHSVCLVVLFFRFVLFCAKSPRYFTRSKLIFTINRAYSSSYSWERRQVLHLWLPLQETMLILSNSESSVMWVLIFFLAWFESLLRFSITYSFKYNTRCNVCCFQYFKCAIYIRPSTKPPKSQFMFTSQSLTINLRRYLRTLQRNKKCTSVWSPEPTWEGLRRHSLTLRENRSPICDFSLTSSSSTTTTLPRRSIWLMKTSSAFISRSPAARVVEPHLYIVPYL